MGEDEDDPPPESEDTLTDDVFGDISSLHSLSSQLKSRSLRVSGLYNQHKFTILIDSGSTHNFVKPALVERLRLTIKSCPRFKVATGCGTFLVCQFCCHGVPLLIQSINFEVDLFILDIEGPDVVLGFPWLESLGKVAHDYSALTMEFMWQRTQVTLKGDTSLASQSVSLHQLQALVHTSNVASIFAITASLQEPDPLPEQSINFPPNLPISVTDLLQHFQSVFATPTGLPPHRTVDHRIHLVEGSKPVNVRPYRYPQFQKSEMEKLIREMLDQGIIVPSHSPFSSPVLLVRKKDGTWRFCVDYRALNSVTVKDKFPIPTIDELLDELGGARIFTKLDLRAGYHQIRVYSCDTYKTAFRTHEGHFEFLVMPFGLTNAPSTFQATMNQLFSQYVRRFVIVFFDDILIYSASLEDHLQHLELVFTSLKTHCFFVKLSKCLFCQESIEYLGHIVSSRGVHADPAKLEAMEKWPTPVTVKQLRGFLGLIGYYRKFIAHYASIASPLTDLLKHDAFTWNEAAQRAFLALKQAMLAAPVLSLPDFSKYFVIETDASNVGIGAVLMQEGHPLAFFSKKLGPKLQAASVYIKELHAITESVLKWRQYLLGHFFVIRTDHKSIKELLQQVIQTPDQQSYVRKLLGFQFRIEYKTGASNKVADALSRVPADWPDCEHTSALRALVSSPTYGIITQLQKDNASDSFYQTFHEQHAQGLLLYPYTIMNGVLLHAGRYVLNPTSSLCDSVISEFHDTPSGGHAGVKRTLVRVAANFYWSGMRKAVENFVGSCLVCQQIKYSTQVPAGLLQPLPIPEKVWEDVTMDFITGLPPSQGSTVIFVVVDRLSKTAHFGALPTSFTASKVAELFVSLVVRHHGYPRSIVSDRDPVFISTFWRKLFELSGTKLAMSSAYHPQTDGQTEVVNRGLEQYLRAFTQHKPSSWVAFLPWAEFHYNTSYHSALKMSPFEALYGRKPPTIPAYARGSTSIQVLDEALTSRDELLRTLKENLTAAQHRMRQKANAHRRDVALAVGDLVLVRLHPYRQTSVRQHKQHKLSKRFYGPYPILERIGAVAYKLQLPSGSHIHPVFHVLALKPFRGTDNVSACDLPLESFDNQPIDQPGAILDRRTQLVHGQPREQLLVHWVGCPIDEASWEDSDNFCTCFPDFHLEDKVSFAGGENDTSQLVVQGPIGNDGSTTTQTENNTEMEDDGPTLGKRVIKKPAWMSDYVCERKA